MSTRGAAALMASMTLLVGCGGGSDTAAQDGPDPAAAIAGSAVSTIAGACSVLVGPSSTLVDDALTAGRAVVDGDGAAADTDRAAKVQEDLFTIVATGPAVLQDAAGQLVDYLDDPEAYETAGEVSRTVTDAVDEIDRICAG